MQIIFRNVKTNQELIMPVTPSDFYVEDGRQVESLDMTDTGQVNLPGLKSLFNEQKEFLLPSSDRNYTSSGWTGEPYAVVDQLVEWSNNGDVLRLIVTDTPVNFPVLLGPVRHGQKDGTGDVYVTLELRRYRELQEEATETNQNTGNKTRAEPQGKKEETSYTVVKGDTLWGIARRTYGDPNLAWKLAEFNGVKNANLIYPGQVVKLPDKGSL
ncbi:LysM peptidoglycan-binding domain-containing protein [uncultured Oscillibacter sp.]|uniref:LysM peptidoglycan-binding domain-containing protein n=1 Tax=uncultured Oscillibacter sp. TaxID=876091 RepID=UPI00260734FF|nr:LysM peptidoglycan-binding domain-containing protein [uncultured Oscillibacter sp.]